MIDVQSSTLIHPGYHLVVSAVESIDTDDASFLLGIGVIRVGGIQIVLKDSQAIEMLYLEDTNTDFCFAYSLIHFHSILPPRSSGCLYGPLFILTTIL